MTTEEFYNWLNDYTKTVKNQPSQDQWNLILKKLSEIKENKENTIKDVIYDYKSKLYNGGSKIYNMIVNKSDLI